MATFVLIHGAFRGGFSFSRLRPLLHAEGHLTHAPSLPGAGEHSAPDARSPSLTDYAECVARFLMLEDLRDVILVGHSQGGLVISAASQLAHERIKQLVFLDSPVARHGEHALELVPTALAHLTLPDFPRDQWIPPRPLSATPHLSPEDAAWLSTRLCPSPVCPSLDPLALDAPEALALPRAYLFCRHTPETFPCAHGRARLEAEGIPYTWIEADHDAPFTAPQHVADALLSLVSGAPGVGP